MAETSWKENLLIVNNQYVVYNLKCDLCDADYNYTLFFFFFFFL